MKKKISVLVCLMLALCLFGSLPTGQIHAEKSIWELQQDAEKIFKEQQALQNKLNSLRENKKSQTQINEVLTQQVTLLNSQIDVLEKRIAAVQKEIAVSEQKIADKEAEIATLQEEYKERMKSNYIEGKASGLELILNSKSLSDFMVRLEYAKKVAEYDQKVLDEMEQMKEELNQQKYVQQENLASIESDKRNIEWSRSEAVQKMEEIKGNLSSIANETQMTEAEIKKNQEEEARISAEIEKQLQAGGSVGEIEGGEWAFPIAGLHGNWYVSSPYGWRNLWGVSDFHRGIDLSAYGVRGKSIVASKSGVVVTAIFNWSYGNYVVIDHGSGYSTVYAHADKLIVNVGQYVVRGQVIGYVGSTGNSSGPHLHFEVRINGQHTNPAPFLKI